MKEIKKILIGLCVLGVVAGLSIGAIYLFIYGLGTIVLILCIIWLAWIIGNEIS